MRSTFAFAFHVAVLSLLLGSPSAAGVDVDDVFVSGRATVNSSISGEFELGSPVTLSANWIVNEGQRRYEWSEAFNFFYMAGDFEVGQADLAAATCISPFCGIVLDDDGVVAGVIGQIIIPVADTPRIRLRIDGQPFFPTLSPDGAVRQRSSSTATEKVCVSARGDFTNCPSGALNAVEALDEEAALEDRALRSRDDGRAERPVRGPIPIDPFTSFEDLDQGVTVASAGSLYLRSSQSVLASRDQTQALRGEIAALRARLSAIEDHPFVRLLLKKHREPRRDR